MVVASAPTEAQHVGALGQAARELRIGMPEATHTLSAHSEAVDAPQAVRLRSALAQPPVITSREVRVGTVEVRPILAVRPRTDEPVEVAARCARAGRKRLSGGGRANSSDNFKLNIPRMRCPFDPGADDDAKKIE